MTHRDSLPVRSTGTDYELLASRFRPIFTRIAEGALERERSRTLPREPIRWLKEAGFGAVRCVCRSRMAARGRRCRSCSSC